MSPTAAAVVAAPAARCTSWPPTSRAAAPWSREAPAAPATPAPSAATEARAGFACSSRGRDTKLEYVDGEIVEMARAGGSPDHALVAANAIGEFSRVLPSVCRPYSS